MILLGTIINSLAVIIGSFLGLTIIKKINESTENILFSIIGVFTLFIGFKMCLSTKQPIGVLISLILGGLIGNLLKIDKYLDSLFEKFKNRFSNNINKKTNFSEGIFTAFLLFCIGSMTIVGAMEEGINRNSSILITKSLMDFFSSIILTSSLGIGVLFSFIPLFIYQSLLTIFFYLFGNFIPQNLIIEISATGGFILVLLSLNLLKLKNFKIINLIPSLILIIPINYIFNKIII
ncbi:MAG: DUF554 domain-containing protein [Spirochaetes bacterium]|nr:DUF554 domain-containing protein [Spirochaetota bacterium]